MALLRIEIDDHKLSSFQSLLNCLPASAKTELKWSLLFIDGVFRNYDYHKLVRDANDQKYGKHLIWNEVEEIVTDTEDLWDFLLVGDTVSNTTIRKDMDNPDPRHAPAYFIELFDSSYIRAYSTAHQFVTNVKALFPNCRVTTQE